MSFKAFRENRDKGYIHNPFGKKFSGQIKGPEGYKKGIALRGSAKTGCNEHIPDDTENATEQSQYAD